ncbi:MAG: hypothetical protein AAGG81_05025, partial [Chlamydiota bacterium]
TDQVCLLKSPRDECFAPLKNAEGDDSVTTVQEALQALDRKIYKKVFSHSPPSSAFELGQELHFLSENGAELSQESHKLKYVYKEG